MSGRAEPCFSSAMNFWNPSVASRLRSSPDRLIAEMNHGCDASRSALLEMSMLWSWLSRRITGYARRSCAAESLRARSS